jgi:hypothetical protein
MQVPERRVNRGPVVVSTHVALWDAGVLLSWAGE